MNHSTQIDSISLLAALNSWRGLPATGIRKILFLLPVYHFTLSIFVCGWFWCFDVLMSCLVEMWLKSTDSTQLFTCKSLLTHRYEDADGSRNLLRSFSLAIIVVYSDSNTWHFRLISAFVRKKSVLILLNWRHHKCTRTKFKKLIQKALIHESLRHCSIRLDMAWIVIIGFVSLSDPAIEAPSSTSAVSIPPPARVDKPAIFTE